jgi:hypothetical protein
MREAPKRQGVDLWLLWATRCGDHDATLEAVFHEPITAEEWKDYLVFNQSHCSCGEKQSFWVQRTHTIPTNTPITQEAGLEEYDD